MFVSPRDAEIGHAGKHVGEISSVFPVVKLHTRHACLFFASGMSHLRQLCEMYLLGVDLDAVELLSFRLLLVLLLLPRTV